MTTNAYDLFNNFQLSILKAVKLFLQINKTDSTIPITTSLRIPGELKDFYECVSQSENTSLNATIVNTLNKVKEQTINEYQKTYSKINEAFDYQINSLLKIIDNHKIDYNDLPILMGWLTGRSINRIDIASKDSLANIFDKDAQLKFSRLFGYEYFWLQDNNRNPHYYFSNLDGRWYKNVQSFANGLITNFYLDKTVESFELSFLCCDKNVVKNIINRAVINKDEQITPIVIANRNIDGLKTRTFHKFESNNINYEKCRLHFVVLINLILEFKLYKIVNYPNGYCLSEQDHDRIQSGDMHLSELFAKKNLYNSFCLDDLKDCYPCGITNSYDNKRGVNKPNMLHGINPSFIFDLLHWANADNKNADKVILTDKLVARCGLDKESIVKYLYLLQSYFILEKKQAIRCLHQTNDEEYYLDLKELETLKDYIRLNECLDTAFG